jgi:hypothetical protein
MNKPDILKTLDEEIEYIHDEVEETEATLLMISNSKDEDAAEAQRQFYISTLTEKVALLKSIEDHLTKLRHIVEVAGGELAIINEMRRIRRIAEEIHASDPLEELPEGTEVMLELSPDGKKTEYVDAEIIGYSEGKPCVRTYWGHVYNLVDPGKIKRREVASV